MIEKDKVRESFSRALQHYDEAALPQQRAAAEMMRIILERAGDSFPRILEIGCGTGSFTALSLRNLKAERRVANDFCEAARGRIEALGGGIEFVCADAESLPFEGPFDLICGCSVIQWFDHQERFFARCRDLLSDGGVMAFSTFCPGNLAEIRQLTGVGLNYHDKGWYESVLSRDFEILCLEESEIRLYFDSPKDVLRHIKMTGAAIGGFRFTPRTFADFDSRYRSLFSDQRGCFLTYNPLYVLALREGLGARG